MTDCTIHESCDRRLTNIEGMVKQIHDVVFVGNGKPPLLTQIANNRLTAWAGVWLIGVGVVAVVGRIVVPMFAK